MQINIKATGIELTPAISDYARRKVSSLEKYLGSDNPNIVAQVEVGKNTNHHKSGEVFRAEVHLVGDGNDLYAVAEKADLYAAIDVVKDEISRELVNSKGKRFALARKGGRMVKDVMKGFPWVLKRLKPRKRNEN